MDNDFDLDDITDEEWDENCLGYYDKPEREYWKLSDWLMCDRENMSRQEKIRFFADEYLWDSQKCEDMGGDWDVFWEWYDDKMRIWEEFIKSLPPEPASLTYYPDCDGRFGYYHNPERGTWGLAHWYVFNTNDMSEQEAREFEEDKELWVKYRIDELGGVEEFKRWNGEQWRIHQDYLVNYPTIPASLME